MSDQRLLQYLDLFPRLRDEELAHLAGVPAAHVVALREKVDRVVRAFAPWADLLDRLDDASLARLTGASAHAVAFWRRSQGVKEPPVQPPLMGASARQGVPSRVAEVDTAPIDVRNDTTRATPVAPGAGRKPGAASVARRPRPSVPYGIEHGGPGTSPSPGVADDDDDDDILVTVDEGEPSGPKAVASGDEEEMDWSDL